MTGQRETGKRGVGKRETGKRGPEAPGEAGTGKPEPFEPFADEAAARTVGALSFENGRDRIALHGSLDITRDRAGLAQARLLKQTLDAIVAALEGADLPEAVAEAPDEPTRTVKNPFA